MKLADTNYFNIVTLDDVWSFISWNVQLGRYLWLSGKLLTRQQRSLKSSQNENENQFVTLRIDLLIVNGCSAGAIQLSQSLLKPQVIEDD